MIGLLVRLRLTLLRNSLGRSVWRVIGLIVGGLYALGLMVAVMAGLLALRFATVEISADVTVLAYALLTVGWLVFSTLIYGVDETVDPARFALLPLRARELLPGLLVGGLVSIPGVLTVILALGQVVTWTRNPVTVLAAAIAVPLGVATCFLVSRTATAGLARGLASRKFRDVALVLFTLLVTGLALGGSLIGELGEQRPEQLLGLLGQAAQVASWTPFGWAWALPGDVARGNWALAGTHLGLAVVLVAVLWRAWAYFLDQRLTEPIEAGHSGGAVKSGRWVDRLYPATPAGGVAARTLRYWRRDPRYLVAVASFFIVPVMIIVTSQVSPAGSTDVVAAFAPALLGLLLGISQASDLSYDGTAVWLHAASGVSGAADRAGRVMSSMTIFGPLLVVLCVVCVASTGDWSLLVASLAATAGVTLVGMGVGSWTGSLWQWAAPPPGANPFGKGSSGLPALLSFAVASGLGLALSLPVIALVVGSLWIGWLGWVALVVGLVGGGLVLKVGIDRGGRLLDRRWPEVLLAVSEKSG